MPREEHLKDLPHLMYTFEYEDGKRSIAADDVEMFGDFVMIGRVCESDNLDIPPHRHTIAMLPTNGLKNVSSVPYQEHAEIEALEAHLNATSKIPQLLQGGQNGH